MIPLVEAELNRRFPGRGDRRAEQPDGLRAAWAMLEPATPDVLASTCTNPWNPADRMTALSCRHVILEEEWEHHRYAVRDLDAIEAKS